MAAKRRKGIGSRRHFNRDRRENLESYLNARVKVAECARLLRVSRKSVYHEIRMGMEAKEGSAVECPYRRGHYVCNGCPKKDSGCAYGRVYYNADLADERAERLKHEANEGTRMPLSEFTDVKERIRDGVKRRISPEVICRGNGEEPRLPVSSSTVRRWIRERRIEGLCDIFLPRAKRYRKAYSRPKTASYGKLRIIKGGHRMSDFLDYVAEHPDAVLIEADSVAGIQTDTRRILTIMFLREHFQYGTVYRTATAAKSVADEFSRLLEAFMPRVHGKPVVVLADNGFEFDAIIPLERKFRGLKVFYTSPYKATDKPHCERNHEELRKRIPKGMSFRNLTQEEVTYTFSCINSLVVESLNWKSPCELFAEAYGKDLMEYIGIRKIPYSEIDLSPMK